MSRHSGTSFSPVHGIVGTVTQEIATYAAVVSTLSLIIAAVACFVAWRAFRSGAPRLEVSSHLRPGDRATAAELRVVVKNVGRATGEVRAIELNVPGPHTIKVGAAPALHGPALPELVPAHSVRAWAVSVDELLAITNRNSWPHQVRAVITTGGLTREWESIHSYTNLLSG